jgi:hypothetical protein
MHNRDISIVLGVVMLRALAFAIAAAVFSAPVAARSRAVETITGRVDEIPGPQYVLRDERELQLIALLDPAGFPNESFAKYMGTKVAVTGEIRSSEGGPPILRVDGINRVKLISDFCGSGPGPEEVQLGREMPSQWSSRPRMAQRDEALFNWLWQPDRTS